MKNIYKKTKNGENLIHFLIPESLLERITGIKAFKWMNPHTVMLFKAPSLLHTFGVKQPISITLFSENLEPSSQPVRVEPNSIVWCTYSRGWVGESFTHCFSKMDFDRNQENTRPEKSEIKIVSTKTIFLLMSLITISFLFSLESMARGASAAIKMQVGTSKEVILQQAPRNLNISNPDVLDVQRIGLSNKILVTALSSGEAVLTAQYPNRTEKQWSFKVGATTVQDPHTHRLSSASLVRTAKELQKRTGLEITIDSGSIAIFGHLSNSTQTKALIEICLGLTECQPRFSLSENALSHIMESMTQHIKQLEFNDVQLIPSFGGIIIKGTVPHETDKRHLMSVIHSVIPKPFDQLTVEKASQSLIETQLSFFRVSETGLTAMGISSTSSSDVRPEGALATISVPGSAAKLKGGPVLNFALPSIVVKALSKKGVIKQIAQPTLVIASGGRGEITSGGELLFQSGGQFQKFLTQNYGITVVLQPKRVGRNKIIQRVDLKITHPQHDPTQNAVSSLTSSTLTTEVSSTPNEQLLLTRISQQAMGKSVSKIPIVGHIPIIGELFKARELNGENAELWITLKSNLVQSTAPLLEPMRESSEINPNFSLLD